MTLFLALKFLLKPAVSGASASDGHAVSTGVWCLAARFVNGCEIHRLNRTVGITLLALGAVTLGIKLFL